MPAGLWVLGRTGRLRSLKRRGRDWAACDGSSEELSRCAVKGQGSPFPFLMDSTSNLTFVPLHCLEPAVAKLGVSVLQWAYQCLCWSSSQSKSQHHAWSWKRSWNCLVWHYCILLPLSTHSMSCGPFQFYSAAFLSVRGSPMIPAIPFPLHPTQLQIVSRHPLEGPPLSIGTSTALLLALIFLCLDHCSRLLSALPGFTLVPTNHSPHMSHSELCKP